MSDNKIYDNLQFDDDIDFDGLDEFEEEISEDLSEMLDECAVIEPETDSYTEEVILEPQAQETVETENPVSEVETQPHHIDLDEAAFSPVEAEEASDISFDTPEVQPSEITVSKKSVKSDKGLKCMCAVNIAVSVITLSVLSLGIYFGYNYIESIKSDLEAKKAEVAELEDKNTRLEADYIEAMNMFEKESEKEIVLTENETEQGKIILYDSYVGYSWMPVLTGIKQNTYEKENFSVDERYRMSYIENGEESSYFGIDVSSYQGDIDWQLVKEDGVEFAFLRIGYRGYGEEGKLCADENFIENYNAARDAGIDLGVYFFSQAATVSEAIEEAEFVLSLLENRQLEYPVVFDWENVYTGDPEDVPRTEDIMPQTLTLSAIAFCETIKDAGYDSMIYTNKKLATIKYDLRQLSEYPIWLAYYDTELNYCYDFDIWQYGTAKVDGIEEEVDVNIAMIK